MDYLSWTMWLLEHLVVATLLSMAAVIALACTALYWSIRTTARPRVGVQIAAAAATVAVSIAISVGLHELWVARREMDQRARTARAEHLQRIQLLLRAESDALKDIAQSLRRGRYFTFVADDARKAVWQDEALTSDVERHFPDYFRERERLIRDVLDQDSEIGRVRQAVSDTLPLTGDTEPYRADIVPALVNRCGGAAPGVTFVSAATQAGLQQAGAGAAGASVGMRNAMLIYEQYRCTPDLVRMAQGIFDRAADLADEASLASVAARRNAEDTVLRGSCTYAPPE